MILDTMDREQVQEVMRELTRLRLQVEELRMHHDIPCTILVMDDRVRLAWTPPDAYTPIHKDFRGEQQFQQATDGLMDLYHKLEERRRR